LLGGKRIRTWSETDRIKVEGRIIAVENIKIGRKTENKGMIIERDRINAERRVMAVNNIKTGKRIGNRT
jgi:hypothetical protein